MIGRGGRQDIAVVGPGVPDRPVGGDGHVREVVVEVGCGRAAGWMSPAFGADTKGKVRGVGDVVDDVIRTGIVAADAGGNIVQLKCVAGAPCDVMVCAGGVTAYADGATLDQAKKRVSDYLISKYADRFDPNFPKSVGSNVVKAYQVTAFAP